MTFSAPFDLHCCSVRNDVLVHGVEKVRKLPLQAFREHVYGLGTRPNLY